MRTPYKAVRIRQQSPEWLAYRRTHIGSSDAPVIAGESPYTSAIELYAEKVSGDQAEIPEGTRVLFRVGHHMEGLILDLYEERTSRKVRRGRILESREIPWLSASLDGEAPDRPVEAKWTNSSRWDDGVPPDVVLQVTHQMGVTGHRVADVAVLRRDGFEIHEVPFERPLWDALLDLEEQFTERLRLRLPPPPDGSESARRAIARLHPEARLGMMDPDAETTSLVRLILDGRERLEILEAEVESWRNTLRYLLGDHEGIEGPGYKVTYRKSRDSHPVSWDLYARSLEKVIGELLEEFDPQNERGVDIAALRDIYTTTQPGPRVLRVTGGSKG